MQMQQFRANLCKTPECIDFLKKSTQCFANFAICTAMNIQKYEMQLPPASISHTLDSTQRYECLSFPYKVQQDKKQQGQDGWSGDIDTYRFILFDRIKSSVVRTTLLLQNKIASPYLNDFLVYGELNYTYLCYSLKFKS